MKCRFRDIKIGFVIVLSIFFAVSVKKLSDHIFSIDGFSCKIDNTISQAQACKIISFLHRQKDLKRWSLQNISEKIKTEFPFIQSVVSSRKASGILDLRLGAVVPIFFVNKMFVLVREGGLFENSFFSKQAIANLACVQVNLQDFTLADSCKKMLKKLPTSCFEQYDLVWESGTKSWLKDKKNNLFAIVFNDTCVVNEKILSACRRLKNNLQERGVFTVKKPKRWVADVRFKDQIIVFSDRGGGDG